MTDKYPVAIVRARDIEAAVRRGIDLMGGIERYVRPGADVIIKVNMFSKGSPESGRVTHPAVPLAVARLCHECGAHVRIVERVPQYGYILRGYEDI
jgi:uncharacterized protein (DUF362 family)